MAMHTRATPGVYATERSSRVFTDILPRTSILPPRCIRKVRSETLTTLTARTPRIFSTICWPWGSSRALNVRARVIGDFPTSLAEGRGDLPEHAGLVRDLQPNCEAVTGAGRLHVDPPLIVIGCRAPAGVTGPRTPRRRALPRWSARILPLLQRISRGTERRGPEALPAEAWRKSVVRCTRRRRP